MHISGGTVFFPLLASFVIFYSCPKSELVKFCNTTRISSYICYDRAEPVPSHSAAVLRRYVLPYFPGYGLRQYVKKHFCSQLSPTSFSKGAG